MKKKVDLAKIAITQEKNQAEKEAKIQEDKINDFEYQNKLLYLKLKEKEKEVHLADLKIKELKRNLIYKLTTIQNNVNYFNFNIDKIKFDKHKIWIITILVLINYSNSLSNTIGNQKSRKNNRRNKINIIKSLNKDKVTIIGKRNSVSDLQKLTHNTLPSLK